MAQATSLGIAGYQDKPNPIIKGMERAKKWEKTKANLEIKQKQLLISAQNAQNSAVQNKLKRQAQTLKGYQQLADWSQEQINAGRDPKEVWAVTQKMLSQVISSSEDAQALAEAMKLGVTGGKPTAKSELTRAKIGKTKAQAEQIRSENKRGPQPDLINIYEQAQQDASKRLGGSSMMGLQDPAQQKKFYPEIANRFGQLAKSFGYSNKQINSFLAGISDINVKPNANNRSNALRNKQIGRTKNKPDRIKVKMPNGEIGFIPREKLPQALKDGIKPVKSPKPGLEGF